MATWTPHSWSTLHARQQPDWPDQGSLDDVVKELRTRPPLIFAGEARALRSELAAASRGEAFVIQAGDCAETFADSSADHARDLLKILLQMAVVLTYSSGLPTVKIGRIAGQYAKPRSQDYEDVAGDRLPSYRGDMVNEAFTSTEARTPDPRRLLTAHSMSASTLNLVRAFAAGGFADLDSVHRWNLEFVANSPEGRRYERIASDIDRALRFLRACKIDSPAMREVSLYSSHEALILPYEEALTRQDSTTDGAWYDCSAHMPWIGTRTKGVGEAHVEFFSGVGNPIGCKIDATDSPQEVVALCQRLNPSREPGRLSLITRMGKDKVRERLEPMVIAVQDEGHPVVWMCDPMHGNTQTTADGIKTRHFDDIFSEISTFFDVHRSLGTWPGGLHLELTGESVTECLGGSHDIQDLDQRYLTLCDPRLNAGQSLDLAFRVAELLQAA